MLNFIGYGSAFNPEYGNTSAFIKREDTMILIDCGGNIFERMLKLRLFDGLKKLHIIITHTHSDHVGSLGEVIFYAHYFDIEVTLIFPEKEIITSLLSCIGIDCSIYNIESDMEIEINMMNCSSVKVSFIRVPHVQNIPSFGFVLEMEGSRCYYSGDSNSIDRKIIRMLKHNKIDYLYQDTCGLDYEGNNHLSLKILTELIPEEKRNKVYCMHCDKFLEKKKVLRHGFNLVESFYDELICGE